MNNTDKIIISEFKARFTFPASIAIAEAMYSRFMAGEDVENLSEDYDENPHNVEYAIRFFILQRRGNLKAEAVYDQMQEARFKRGKED